MLTFHSYMYLTAQVICYNHTFLNRFVKTFAREMKIIRYISKFIVTVYANQVLLYCVFTEQLLITSFMSFNVPNSTINSLGRTRIGRTLRMAQTDLKVLSIFLIFLSKKKSFRSNTNTSNSRTQ